MWPEFGIEHGDTVLEFDQLFGRSAEVIVEIGFGNGTSTWQMAQLEADRNFIGIEVHEPGVGQLLLALQRHGLTNVRLVRGDAVPFLQQRIAPGSLAGVRVYFPDPWPKRRHHKRRIIQPEFISQLARCITNHGILHLATDWQAYADHMLEVMQASPDFANLSATGDYCDRPGWRPHTKYELRGENLGHAVRDLLFEKLV